MRSLGDSHSVMNTNVALKTGVVIHTYGTDNVIISGMTSLAIACS